MIDPKTEFGSLVTGDWPDTVAKNASGASASDGTPFTASLIDMFMGWQKRIMVLANLTPNGSADTKSASQIVDAIRRVGPYPGLPMWSALNSAALALTRLLPMAGQTVAIADYPDLVANTYCGDADNPTAEGFYKINSDGTTRNTAGTHFKIPDARGLFLRAIGTNQARTMADGSTPYAGQSKISKFMADMMFGHRHLVYAGQNAISAMSNNTPVMGATTYVGTPTNGQVLAPSNDGVHGNPNAGGETAPASLSFQLCISY